MYFVVLCILLCLWMCSCMVEWQRISVELFEVNETESWRTLCMPWHVSMCTRVSLCSSVSVWVRAHVHTHMCVYLSLSVTASAYPVRALHTSQPFSPLSPWGAVSLPLGLRVSMCNNDYLHLNHKEQENPDNCNTQRNPHLHPHISRPWWNMMAGFALLSTALAKSRHT